MENSYTQSISKISYYCQSTYTSINLFNDLVQNRNYLLLDNLLNTIIDYLSNCIKFYLQTDMNVEIVYNINYKLQLILKGYENKDYFYIKDVFEYEIIQDIEYIFQEIQFIIENRYNKI